MLYNGAQVSFEYISQLLQPLIIFFLGLVAFAGAFAIAKVILEAYFEFAFVDIIGAQVQFAGTQLNIGLYKIEQFAYPGYRGKRAQVFTAVGNFAAGKKNAGKVLFFDNNVWVRFIIFQIDVKTGLKLFYQRVLQQKGILLAWHNGELYALYTLNQLMRFVRGERFGKIRAYTLAEVFCFTYIKQCICRIVIFVNTGFNR
jgi:hypothetical protein